jgi:hypothetical protein
VSQGRRRAGPGLPKPIADAGNVGASMCQQRLVGMWTAWPRLPSREPGNIGIASHRLDPADWTRLRDRQHESGSCRPGTAKQ